MPREDHAREGLVTSGARSPSFPITALWRLFWGIAALQGIDLVTTYAVLASGGREGNIFLKQIILTPLAPILKLIALAFFAMLIAASGRLGKPDPRRLSIAGFAILIFYVLLDINNVIVLLRQH